MSGAGIEFEDEIMARLSIPARNEAPEASRPILDAAEKQLGMVPNLYRLLALSPAVLQGYAANGAALSRTLDVKTRERIAIAAAEINGCDYCLSAHSYIGENLARLSPEEIALNRAGTSGEAKADAAVRLAASLVRERGHVGAAEIEAARRAGFSDKEIVEIAAVAAENVFTNLVNNLAETDIDFPVVHAARAA